MQIDWDMPTYNRMAPDAQQQVDAAKQWLSDNENLAIHYVMKVSEDHPALWFARVMMKVEEAIDNKEQDAVDLACLYVIHGQKAPFGKIHKSNVLVRLKRNKELIKRHYIPKLTSTLEKFNLMKYPPREVRELSKLLESLS